MTPDNLDRLEELAACGVVGFKAFSCYSGIPEFKGIDDYSALKGMEIIKKLGLPLMVHCENDALTAKLGAEQAAAGRDDAWAYFAAHAPITEIESITRMITFAEETGRQADHRACIPWQEHRHHQCSACKRCRCISRDDRAVPDPDG